MEARARLDQQQQPAAPLALQGGPTSRFQISPLRLSRPFYTVTYGGFLRGLWDYYYRTTEPGTYTTTTQSRGALFNTLYSPTCAPTGIPSTYIPYHPVTPSYPKPTLAQHLPLTTDSSPAPARFFFYLFPPGGSEHQMSQTLTDQADRCLGKRPLLQLHLGPPMPSAKRPCTMATRAATATTGTTLTNNSIPQNEQGESSSAAAGSQDWDAPAWDTSLLPQLPFPPSSSRSSDDATLVLPPFPSLSAMQK